MPSPVWRFPNPKKGTNRVYPDILQSVGLTNFQNTPNARRLTHNAHTTDMNIIEKLKELLGINPEEAEEAIVSHVESLIAARDGAVQKVDETANADAEAMKAELAAEKTKREAAENALQVHRTTAANAMLDVAIEGGALTLAERPGWEQRFATDYEGAANAIVELKTPSLNTKPLDLSEAKPGIAPDSSMKRIAAFNALVSAECGRNGGNYDAAVAAVKADPKHASLITAMKPAQEDAE